MEKNKKGSSKEKGKDTKKDKKRDIIKLEDVCKRYRMGNETVEAVCHVSISFKESDFISILGPSGSGKSTLMNLVGSLDTPSKGKIYLDNRDIGKLSESSLAQIRGKKVGFIFQQFNLIPNLTAKENVMLPMVFQNKSEAKRSKRAKELLDMVQLKNRVNHYPNQLSGGQQQRVAIARSLSNDPEVVLADEPTGNLDTKTGEIVLTFLQKLHKKGKTIVMVTHDEDLAREYSEIIYHLVDGEIQKTERKK